MKSKFLIALAFAAAAAAASAQQLRIGLAEDPDVLDPSLARTFVGRIVFSALCDKLVDIDEKRARDVAARDDEIDQMYHRTFEDVLEEMRSDPEKVDPGTRILFAAHYLERIGDRVTNIAEDVVFLATGEVEDLNT